MTYNQVIITSNMMLYLLSTKDNSTSVDASHAIPQSKFALYYYIATTIYLFLKFKSKFFFVMISHNF